MNIQIRNPKKQDASQVYTLIQNSPPLDLNSFYLYLLQCTHFSETCAVATDGETIVGFLSGYLHPRDPSKYFVWQVVVSKEARGKGVAKKLLNYVFNALKTNGVESVQATVGPTNLSSKKLFQSFAREHDASFSEELMFEKDLFPGTDHEEEILMTIGPIK